MSQIIGAFNSYSPWCDAAVISICAIMLILLRTSYVSRTESYYIFLGTIRVLIAAALITIIYHTLVVMDPSGFFKVIYGLRILYHMLLLMVFHFFVLYTVTVSNAEHRKARTAAIISTILLAAAVGADIAMTLTGNGFRISPDGVITDSIDVFMAGYVMYIILLLFVMRNIRHLVFSRIMVGFYCTMILAVAIRFAQLPFGQTSLTTMTFVFPVIAMMYIIHANPYDVSLGTVDSRSMEDMVRSLYNRKEPFMYMSLLLPEFNTEGKQFSSDIRAQIRRFSVNFFNASVVFQISNGHIVMIIPKRRNPDLENAVREIMNNFYEQYKHLHYAYKILIGDSVDEISRKNEYASLIISVQDSIPENTVYHVGPSDIARFNKNERVLQELTDIHSRRDLDDPRVLAFCQPVFNIKTGRFDTAEALMRLKLSDTEELVPPDLFIPMAESQGYIHVLTEIILHKTCCAIRDLLDEGYQLTRISVNVSVPEVKDDGFCSDIMQIIGGSGIPADKIAIELTESRNEADFMIMKEKIEQLRSKGIRFYLDDFGTGYSNMERIMDLPFDIIKFDRSLVAASRDDERSEKIVENLAKMFREMDYSLLYEGVENNVDEEHCREMSASYLQGFKYSRPIPIEELPDFLTKAV